MRTKWWWMAAAGLGVVWGVVACEADLEDPDEIWIVADTPTVSFNGEGVEVTGDFSRVTGALLLNDGRIVVADQARVRVFDSTGRFLHGFGSTGEGPGEWRGIAWIQYLPGDSLLVADVRNTNRLWVFALDGTLGRTMRLEGTPAQTFGAFADGTVVGGTPSTDTSVPFSVVRGALTFLRYDVTGEVLDSLGGWPDDEVIVLWADGFTLATGTKGLYLTTVAVGPQEVYVSTGERLGASVLGTAGDTLRALEAAHELIPFSTEDMARASTGVGLSRLIEEQLASESFEPWPEDKSLNVVVDLLVDAVGNLWAMELQLDDLLPSEWTVFSPEGAPTARVEMPMRFAPHQIGDDFVLGVWRDELDVEHVQLRSLTKPGAVR